MNTESENSKQIAHAEIRDERAKAIMDSLAGFCHALGQPATVLMSSIELLKMTDVDEETKKQIIDMCYDATMEIKSLLAEMKKKREYLVEAYLKGDDNGGNILAINSVANK